MGVLFGVGVLNIVFGVSGLGNFLIWMIVIFVIVFFVISFVFGNMLIYKIEL